MVTNDSLMNRFKHNVMEEVCRLEWCDRARPEEESISQ